MAERRGNFAEQIIALGLAVRDRLSAIEAAGPTASNAQLLERVVEEGVLTRWQATRVIDGRGDELVLGPFRLIEPLGAGGMARVFRARDTRSGALVAIKLLSEGSADADSTARLKQEGRLAQRLDHPNVVRTFELAEYNRRCFIVMELVDGPSLGKYLSRHGRLSPMDAARLGWQVAKALHHAFQQGIIHRDIKPSNILLSTKGRALVADLGLARLISMEHERTRLTHTGTLMGTIDYLSPEQAEDARRADARSDIYSLGCTLYHCLVGQPPFPDGTEVQRILAHRERNPVRLSSIDPQIPAALSRLICEEMLAKDPARRPQTPGEVARLLKPWTKAAAYDALAKATGAADPTGELFEPETVRRCEELQPRRQAASHGSSTRGIKGRKGARHARERRFAAILIGAAVIVGAGILWSASAFRSDPVVDVVSRGDEQRSDAAPERARHDAPKQSRVVTLSASVEDTANSLPESDPTPGRETPEKVASASSGRTTTTSAKPDLRGTPATLPGAPTIEPPNLFKDWVELASLTAEHELGFQDFAFPFNWTNEVLICHGGVNLNPKQILPIGLYRLELGKRDWFVYDKGTPFKGRGVIVGAAGVACSLDRRYWAVAYNPVAAEVYDLTSGRDLKPIAYLGERDAEGLLKDKGCLQTRIEFSPDGRVIATCSPSNFSGGLWQRKTSRKPDKLYAYDSSFAPDSQRIAVVTRNRGLEIRAIADPEQAILSVPGDYSAVDYLANETLVLGSRTGLVELRRTTDAQVLREIGLHDGQVTAIAVDAASQTIASSGARDREVRLWRASDGTMLRRFGPFPANCSGIKFHSTGRAIGFVIDGPMNTVVVWGDSSLIDR